MAHVTPACPAQLIVSASWDGTVALWTSNGQPVQTIGLPGAVYAAAWHSERRELLIGLRGGVSVLSLAQVASDGEDDVGSGDREQLRPIDPLSGDDIFDAKGRVDCRGPHADASVIAVACGDSRAYSAGLDGRLAVYELGSYPGMAKIAPVTVKQAHRTGIKSMIKVEGAFSFLATSSFDNTVKLWTLECGLTHVIPFRRLVDSIMYEPNCKTLWLSVGRRTCVLLDPKSGENVSDVVGTFADTSALPSIGYRTTLLQ